MKMRAIKSVEEFFDLIESNDLETFVSLGILKASHHFSKRGRHIFDFSLVDGSSTRLTKNSFKEGYYFEAIQKKTLILENMTPR